MGRLGAEWRKLVTVTRRREGDRLMPCTICTYRASSLLVLMLASVASSMSVSDCNASVQLHVLSVEVQRCSFNQFVNACTGTASGILANAYLRPASGGSAAAASGGSVTAASAATHNAVCSLPLSSQSAIPSIGKEQSLLVPCLPASGEVSVCFAVSCCTANGGGDSALGAVNGSASLRHSELCLDLAVMQLSGSNSSNASQSPVLLEDGQTSLLVAVSGGEHSQHSQQQQPVPGSPCNCELPLCRVISFLPGCATRQPDSPDPKADSSDGGLSTTVIIVLVVVFSVLIGTGVCGYFLVKAGCCQQHEPCSTAYGGAKSTDNSMVSTNTQCQHVEIRALQDLTFGRMSPDLSQGPSRHQSSYRYSPGEEEPDANVPLPPLPYSEIIESGSFAKWIDCIDIEGSRTSVASLASNRRNDATQVTLHTNTVALSLNELDNAEPDIATGEHIGTSV
ncbi:uncharacterized protein LOC135816922 [Sycon ciliatum]|uniref:uncharacterized protein LOC135816922 n=1 Tax=Sycon ciliatum TaxID=27933 RepID=UPI0031F6AEB0